jgi:hypothetical protein
MHRLDTFVRQRVYQIACGYADQNDADTLRTDPLLKLVCGRLPESGAVLASQPTRSRLENAVDRRTIERLAAALVDLYLDERGRQGRPPRILLDVDGTDDPAHGQQEGVRYHGDYGQHMYHPLLVFDGDTGHLITAPWSCGRTVALPCPGCMPGVRRRRSPPPSGCWTPCAAGSAARTPPPPSSTPCGCVSSRSAGACGS